MQRKSKPESLYLAERKGLRALIGAIFILLACGLIAGGTYAILHVPAHELTDGGRISQTAAIAVLTAEIAVPALIFLMLGALNLRKLAYRYTFWADEAGIHNHYKILCTGTISWDEVKEITLHRLSFDEVVEKCVLIYFKDAKALKARRNFIWRMQKHGHLSLGFRMTYASREEICARLCKMLDYYGDNTGVGYGKTDKA